MSNTLNRFSPDQLNPTELDEVLIHGFTNEQCPGLCAKCRPHRLQEFFRWFNSLPSKSEDFECYIEDVEDEAKKLQITDEEWKANGEQKQYEDELRWQAAGFQFYFSDKLAF